MSADQRGRSPLPLQGARGVALCMDGADWLIETCLANAADASAHGGRALHQTIARIRFAHQCFALGQFAIDALRQLLLSSRCCRPRRPSLTASPTGMCASSRNQRTSSCSTRTDTLCFAMALTHTLIRADRNVRRLRSLDF